MLKLFNSKEEEAKAVSDFINPFQKDNVEKITIEIGKTPSIFRGNKCIECTVWFKNGASHGCHELHSDDLQDVFNRMNEFINAL